MHTTRPSAGTAAVELYNIASNVPLGETATRALDDMLATNENQVWEKSQYHADDALLFDLRALAGLYLFNERVAWVGYHYRDTENAFHRLRTLIEDEPSLRDQVKRMSGTHGGQQIQLNSGARLSFGTHIGRGCRGFSFDCYIATDVYRYPGYPLVDAWYSLAASKNPQLVYS